MQPAATIEGSDSKKSGIAGGYPAEKFKKSEDSGAIFSGRLGFIRACRGGGVVEQLAASRRVIRCQRARQRA
jgi:hypothetical protein